MHAQLTANQHNTRRETVHHLIPEDFGRFTQVALLNEVRLLMAQERRDQVLRELDARDQVDGKPMRLTRWLHDVFGITFGTAREKVRTARALASLPAIDRAFRDGQLSYSKVRALTRVATSDNEQALLKVAQHTSADGVEQLVRRVKQDACIEDVQALIQSRAVSTRWDESGALIVQGRLTPEQGAVFLKALAKATEAQPADDEYWARRADALTQIMADSLAGQGTSATGTRWWCMWRRRRWRRHCLKHWQKTFQRERTPAKFQRKREVQVFLLKRPCTRKPFAASPEMAGW